jgi:hypothetical protein
MPKNRAVDDESELGSTAGDDDDEEEAAPVRKKARAGRSAFIDDEVDVEDEDEEDEDEDEEGGPDEYEEEEGAENIAADQAEAMNRKLDAQRRKEEEEKLREQVRQRYESADRAQVEYADDDDEGDTRFRDLPDASRDPKLWLMRCKPNQEKMLVRGAPSSPPSPFLRARCTAVAERRVRHGARARALRWRCRRARALLAACRMRRRHALAPRRRADHLADAKVSRLDAHGQAADGQVGDVHGREGVHLRRGVQGDPRARGHPGPQPPLLSHPAGMPQPPPRR